MQEIPFSVPVSGTVKIDGSSITITINRSETFISFEPETPAGARHSALERGRTTYDVILESAREFIRRNGYNRFLAPELYDIAHEKYPELKKNSFLTRVISSSPNHPSYKYYSSRRDYFVHMINGIYQLDAKYVVKDNGETGNPNGASLFMNRD
ncbi:hypothetical protein [Dehalogenimonas etheniformans]|uniref:Uncharacterized protein n=1 Tax=Dehalogenimonas etheniformans TaxID=1536648 RepID=A0A2P5P5L1_9CHLR|nr:hypothetical protein [Dehalogenimonas etheniformans]PPD57574.1 hypothetical protein JP09_007440 [Dehalogenimonas etheniformans]QNT75912.1 hypothetical protein HX448_04020 [Dehalogenimonas etheniformans]